MWTPVTRSQHDRDHLRYGSDLTDKEQALLRAAPAAHRRHWSTTTRADARGHERP